MGCIHSIQGYDLNYAFVILGKDIGYSKESRSIIVRQEHYYDKNGNLKPFALSPMDARAAAPDIFCAPTIESVCDMLRDAHMIHVSTKPYVTVEGFFYLYEVYGMYNESGMYKLLASKTGFGSSCDAEDAGIAFAYGYLIGSHVVV